MSGIVVFTFGNSNREDIIRIQYEAGSNPGSTRLVVDCSFPTRILEE